MSTFQPVLITRQPDKLGNCNLVIRYSIASGKYCFLPTKIKLHPTFWLEREGVVRRGARDKELIEETIEKCLQLAKRIKSDVLAENLPESLDEMRKRYKATVNLQPVIRLSVEQYWKKMMADKKKGHTIGDGTMNRYRALLNHLIDFAEYKKSPLNFDLFNKDFGNDFHHYGYSKGLVTATVGKMVKTVRTFIKWSNEREYCNIAHYTIWNIDTKAGLKPKPLNEEHLEMIQAYIDTEDCKEPYRTVGALFLTLTSTALRFSDLFRVTFDSVQFTKSGKAYIAMSDAKTHTSLTIPINKVIIRQIQFFHPNWTPENSKNFGVAKIFKPFPLQRFNSYLKLLGKFSKLDDIITIEERRGNEITKLKIPRYENLSSHDGRRTYITTRIARGKSPHIIASVSGHKTVSQLLTYYEPTDNIVDQMLDEDGF